MSFGFGDNSAGDIPEWRDKFESSSNVQFKHPIDDATAEWWHEKFGQPFNLYPHEMAESLSINIPGRVKHKYEIIDRHNEIIRISIEAFDLFNEWISLSGQSLDLTTSIINSDAYFVEPPYQRQGIGNSLVSNCFDLACKLKMSEIKLKAQDQGPFVWAEYGFLPTPEAWITTVVPAARDMLQHIRKYLSNTIINNIEATLRMSDPKAIRDIIAIEDLIPSLANRDKRGTPSPAYDKRGCQVFRPVGWVLLVDGRTEWEGGLNLKDRYSLAIFDETRRGER
jgi:hypothetical protein